MKSLTIRQEEYPLVGMALSTSFERDKALFAEHYKSMDETYLKTFNTHIDAVKKLHSTASGLAAQKEATAKVYDLQKDLLRRAMFLKDYATYANADTKAATAATKTLRKSDTEAAIKHLRQAVVFYTPLAGQLTDMPEAFLEKIAQDTDQLETLNNEQNTAINFRTGLTAENRETYNVLDATFSKICNAGKRLFRGTPKADEYTLSKILKRIRATAPKKPNTPQA